MKRYRVKYKLTKEGKQIIKNTLIILIIIIVVFAITIIFLLIKIL